MIKAKYDFTKAKAGAVPVVLENAYTVRPCVLELTYEQIALLNFLSDNDFFDGDVYIDYLYDYIDTLKNVTKDMQTT